MIFASLPDALLKSVIQPLALLLLPGAADDIAAAWKAAIATLRTYDPRTEAELRLAARIVCFNLQAGEAVAQAGLPDMPILRAIRLRAGAVALSREADRAEARLERHRAARLTADTQTTAPQTVAPLPNAPLPKTPVAEPAVASADAAAPESPRVQRATALIDDTRKIAAYAQANGLTWADALRQREREQRLARRQARQAATEPSRPIPMPA